MTLRYKNRSSFLALVGLWLWVTAANAHTGAGGPVGFVGGAMHPITGFDHLAAIIALGMMAARYHQGRQMFLLPVLFPTGMAIGAVAGLSGLAPPLVEQSIAVSVIALGGLVALAWLMPLRVVAALTVGFAFFHGVAHGAEFSGGNVVAYVAGFVMATLGLHLGSLASAWTANKYGFTFAPRLAGVGLACLGVFYLVEG